MLFDIFRSRFHISFYAMLAFSHVKFLSIYFLKRFSRGTSDFTISAPPPPPAGLMMMIWNNAFPTIDIFLFSLLFQVILAQERAFWLSAHRPRRDTPSVYSLLFQCRGDGIACTRDMTLPRFQYAAIIGRAPVTWDHAYADSWTAWYHTISFIEERRMTYAAFKIITYMRFSNYDVGARFIFIRANKLAGYRFFSSRHLHFMTSRHVIWLKYTWRSISMVRSIGCFQFISRKARRDLHFSMVPAWAFYPADIAAIATPL